jgi:hypothetical protein
MRRKSSRQDGNRQQATSNRQASQEGYKGEWANGRMEKGSKQQAAGNRQASQEG